LRFIVDGEVNDTNAKLDTWKMLPDRSIVFSQEDIDRFGDWNIVFVWGYDATSNDITNDFKFEIKVVL